MHVWHVVVPHYTCIDCTLLRRHTFAPFHPPHTRAFHCSPPSTHIHLPHCTLVHPQPTTLPPHTSFSHTSGVGLCARWLPTLPLDYITATWCYHTTDMASRACPPTFHLQPLVCIHILLPSPPACLNNTPTPTWQPFEWIFTAVYTGVDWILHQPVCAADMPTDSGFSLDTPQTTVWLLSPTQHHPTFTHAR